MRDCAALVSSKNRDRGASLEAQFQASLTHCGSTSSRLLIALSGGLDSVVLLALAADWLKRGADTQNPRSETADSPLEMAVRAVYIDHGLQSQSAQWGKHCAKLCESLSVSFQTIKVSVDLDSGLSPEAAARDARYAALEAILSDDEYCCTAHHADDQAETLLIQLFRGAGVHGLAGMPACREFANGYLLRPLLNVSRAELYRYAQDQKLEWIEDPSNADTRYDRNFIRSEVLPLIAQRWPQVTRSLSRSAGHCGDAMQILNRTSVMDLQQSNSAISAAGSESVSATPAAELSVSHLQQLPLVRRKNAIRYWISDLGFRPPSDTQLRQIQTDLLDTDASGHIKFGTAQIARYQDNLFIGSPGQFDPAEDFEYQWQDRSKPLFIEETGWHLDASDRPQLTSCSGQTLTVRNRRGGERIQLPGRDHSVSVKSLLQERRVPPWQRSRLALVFSGDQLIDICGPEFYL